MSIYIYDIHREGSVRTHELYMYIEILFFDMKCVCLGYKDMKISR